MFQIPFSNNKKLNVKVKTLINYEVGTRNLEGILQTANFKSSFESS